MCGNSPKPSSIAWLALCSPYHGLTLPPNHSSPLHTHTYLIIYRFPASIPPPLVPIHKSSTHPTLHHEVSILPPHPHPSPPRSRKTRISRIQVLRQRVASRPTRPEKMRLYLYVHLAPPPSLVFTFPPLLALTENFAQRYSQPQGAPCFLQRGVEMPALRDVLHAGAV